MTEPLRTEIALIVFDFDGVMTDNRVYVFQDGREAAACNRADGLGVDLLRGAGIPMVLLSTERNPIVTARAVKLRINCVAACADKAAALTALATERGVNLASIMYVGNDINDLAAMRLVGWPVAPADAHPSIRAIARMVTVAKGGDGVVREIADRLLAAELTGPCTSNMNRPTDHQDLSAKPVAVTGPILPRSRI